MYLSKGKIFQMKIVFEVLFDIFNKDKKEDVNLIRISFVVSNSKLKKFS